MWFLRRKQNPKSLLIDIRIVRRTEITTDRTFAVEGLPVRLVPAAAETERSAGPLAPEEDVLQAGNLSRARRLVVLLALLPLFSGCNANLRNLGGVTTGSSTAGTRLKGIFHGGQQPVSGTTLQLYATGSAGDGSPATALILAHLTTSDGTSTLDANANAGNDNNMLPIGSFDISGDYTCPSSATQVYLVGTGGNPGLGAGATNPNLALMVALGTCGSLSSATYLSVNELTTVGSLAPISAFMNSYATLGSNSNDAAALVTALNLVPEYTDIANGVVPGPALPAGFYASSTEVTTLADIMATCINSAGGVATDTSTTCGQLFSLTPSAGGIAPTDTIGAILNILKSPTTNVASIYNLLPATPPYQPTLTAAPATWALPILPTLTIATPDPLVGIGQTLTATVTLGQAAPAGGLTLTIATSNASNISVSMATVPVAAGQTSATFTYAGVAAQPATLSVSAPGYEFGAATVRGTTAQLSLGTIPTIAPGQSTSLALSIGSAAPAGGVVVNFSSNDTTKATVTSSVTIPAGSQLPSSNPQVTGVDFGTVNIHASSSGYAPADRSVVVTINAAFPSAQTISLSQVAQVTLTLSSPAPSGGLVFNLSSDNTSYATVPTTVTVPAGATTVSVPVTGAGAGTTTIRADHTGITEATSSITVAQGISVNNLLTGSGLYLTGVSHLNAPATSPVSVTLTSSDPAVFLLTSNAANIGTSSITFTNVTGSTFPAFYVQGRVTGTTAARIATLTVAATGYGNGTGTVEVDPSGFVFGGATLSTNTLAAATNISISPTPLYPSNLVAEAPGCCNINPGMGNVSVGVTSTTTSTPASATVGTITTSPVVFAAGAYQVITGFQPSTAGTATLALVQPTGFYQSSSSIAQVAATVTAPAIAIYPLDIQGAGVSQKEDLVIPVSPNSSENVTLSVPDTSKVRLATTAGGAGSSQISIPFTSAGYLGFYIQGVSVGTVTLTVSAPNYSSATAPITIDPLGITYDGTPNISTTTLSSPSTIYLGLSVLDPGSLQVVACSGGCPLNPGAASVSIPINIATTSSPTSTTVGTVSSPVTFSAGQSNATATFTPTNAGTASITLGTQPAGFSTPSQAYEVAGNATVTAPAIGYQGGALLGVNLSSRFYFALSQTPPSAETVTVSVPDASIVALSADAGTAGGSSLQFNISDTSFHGFFLQGQAQGTVNLTISAPNFATFTIALTVEPSGVILNSSPPNTTTFSAPSTVGLQVAALTPSSLAFNNDCPQCFLSPGHSVSIGLNNSNPAVGTLSTSTATIAAGSSSATLSFTPRAAGQTTISLGTQPTGFSQTSTISFLQQTATVTAPNIIITNYGNVLPDAGIGFYTTGNAALSQTPPSPVTVTVSVPDTSIVLLSTSSTTVGSSSITFSNVTGALPPFYLQGQAQGSTTVTISAPGFNNATTPIAVDPSGFILTGGNYSTSISSGTSSIGVSAAVLNPGTLTYERTPEGVSPGTNPVVTLTSTMPQLGTVTTSVSVVAGQNSGSGTFTPLNAGTTNVTLTQPPGYTATSSTNGTTYLTQTVTVTSP